MTSGHSATQQRIDARYLRPGAELKTKTILAACFAGVAGIVKFMADKPAAEVQTNIESYIGSPFLRGIFVTLYGLIVSPITLAISFFFLGCVVGSWFSQWRSKGTKLSPLEVLATDVSLAAYSLDNMSYFQTDGPAIANLNVVLNKLRAQSFTMPPHNNGVLEREKMSQYLHQIAAYMREGQYEAAKGSAKAMVEKWEKPSF